MSLVPLPPPGYTLQEKAEFYKSVAEENIRANIRLTRRVEALEEKYEGKKRRALYKRSPKPR